MGDPKKPRKKYSTPRHPWRSDQLAHELYLLGTYGLRNKKELWRAQTELSRIRKQARTLLAASEEIREKEERTLLQSLRKKGIVGENSNLDDVLSLTLESLLERRLQTMVWRKGLARTIYEARQMIVHGHITVGGRVIRVPSYHVTAQEENTIRINENSPLLAQRAVR